MTQTDLPFVSLACLMCLAACCVLALGEMRTRAFALKWDGMQWSLGDPKGTGFPAQVSIRPMLDLDQFVLLRWQGVDTNSAGWLAVQSDALQAWQWHALRCAIHTPVAGPLTVIPADPGVSR